MAGLVLCFILFLFIDAHRIFKLSDRYLILVVARFFFGKYLNYFN